jgi:hypothetical protein
VQVALVLGLIYSGNHLGTVGGISANNVNKAFGIVSAQPRLHAMVDLLRLTGIHSGS